LPSAVDYGVEDVKDIVANLFELEYSERGSELDLLCPNPKHNDSNPSCSINSDTGYWHCLSCGVGGDLADLGALVLKRPLADVTQVLRPSTPEAMLAAFQRRVARLSEKHKSPHRGRRLALKEYDPPGSPISELEDRDFTQETLERWGVRYIESEVMNGNKGEYTITNSLAIPVRNHDGRLLAWCYRSTDKSAPWQPRYLYTPGVEISELWFGLQHHSNVDHIAIVEGALDAMWEDQCGYPALGLLGSNMGENKIRWLRRYKSVTLVPDLDTAGMRWCIRVGDDLSTRTSVYVARYRDWMLKKRPERDGGYRRAKDPEELRPVDLELMHATAMPYIMWRRLIKSVQ
jgi:hypothetical protein